MTRQQDTSYHVEPCTMYVHIYQRLLFEKGRGSIKHEDGFDPVVQQLTDAMEQQDQVGIWDRLSLSRAHALNSLVQPYANIWGHTRREGGMGEESFYFHE